MFSEPVSSLWLSDTQHTCCDPRCATLGLSISPFWFTIHPFKTLSFTLISTTTSPPMEFKNKDLHRRVKTVRGLSPTSSSHCVATPALTRDLYANRLSYWMVSSCHRRAVFSLLQGSYQALTGHLMIGFINTTLLLLVTCSYLNASTNFLGIF